MADILFEIGLEEVPARFMTKLLSEVSTKIGDGLKAQRLTYAALKAVGTDRRVAVLITGLTDQQADVDREVKGPPAEIAFKDGKLTTAGEGFCKKNGLDTKAVQQKNIGGKDYLYARVFEKGRSAKEVLAELYVQVLQNTHLPIAMRWGSLDVQFIRPIHWLLSLYNNEVLPLTYAGITAGRTTRGHRFISNREIEIPAAQDYVAILEKNKVYVDQNLRKDMITAQILQIEKDKGLKAIIAEDVLNEVVYINECPTAVVAEIDEKYLSVPQECLITTMQKNQKYFPLLKDGKLTKYFVLISNNVNQGSLANIIAGNVKVVTARLEDAKFFFEEDKKVKMEKWVENLKKVTYHEKLGTIYGKIERIQKIALWLADKVKADKVLTERVAFLAKADLDSKMVFEFPELQGIMGRYYAVAHQEQPEVAEAILDHWKPRYAGEDVSKVNIYAALVAIADKIDSIAGCFSVGLIPTSSSDPYALRRAAQGVVSLLLTKKLDIDLKDLIAFAVSLTKAEAKQKLAEEINQFFILRLKNVLQEAEHSYDVIEAVLSVDVDDVFKTIEFAKVVAELKANKAFVESAVRVSNIVEKEKLSAFDPGLCVLPAEQKLADAYTKASVALDAALKAKKYADVAKVFAGLVGPITEFFNDVLVMDKDAKIKNNRVGLLKSLEQLFKKTANYKKIVL